MPAQPDFKVKVREVPLERHLELPPALLTDVLAGFHPTPEPGEVVAPGEITAEISLTLEHATVFADGTLQGWVAVACSRCLAAARLRVEEPFHVTFLPHQAASDDAEELELNEDDLDVATYVGEEIDLEPQLREQLLLALPIAPLCDELCKGLCVQCGADLNAGPCGCPPLPADPRFAVLKNIKP